MAGGQLPEPERGMAGHKSLYLPLNLEATRGVPEGAGVLVSGADLTSIPRFEHRGLSGIFGGEYSNGTGGVFSDIASTVASKAPSPARLAVRPAEAWTWEWWRYLCSDWRRATRHALEDPSSSWSASCFHGLVVCIILASTLCAILVTVQEVEQTHSRTFQALEEAFTVMFTAEIIVRAWATSCSQYFGAASNWVDVLATLPWYIEAGIQQFMPQTCHSQRCSTVAGSFRTLRMARLVRMVRLAKVARHSETVAVCLESIVASRTGLFVLVSFVGMGTVLAATAMYAVEADVKGGHFDSIPVAMWWALTTITTVGYGDLVPSTLLGKCVGSVTMVCGTLIVSLSVAMISSTFTEHYRHKSELHKVRKAMRLRMPRASDSFQMHVGEESAHLQRTTSRMLAYRLADLEEEMKGALALLESEAIQFAEARMECSGAPRRETSPMRVRRRPDGAEQADMLLECLRGQLVSWFKAARALAEHLAEEVPHREKAKSGHLGCCLVPSVCRAAHGGTLDNLRDYEVDFSGDPASNV